MWKISEAPRYSRKTRHPSDRKSFLLITNYFTFSFPPKDHIIWKTFVYKDNTLRNTSFSLVMNLTNTAANCQISE